MVDSHLLIQMRIKIRFSVVTCRLLMTCLNELFLENTLYLTNEHSFIRLASVYTRQK